MIGAFRTPVPPPPNPRAFSSPRQFQLSLPASSPGRSDGVRLWNLKSCFENVDGKCWLTKMTLVMTSLSLARVFQCLFLYDSSVYGEPQGSWGWNSNSRDVVESSPSISRPADREFQLIPLFLLLWKKKKTPHQDHDRVGPRCVRFFKKVTTESVSSLRRCFNESI